jgi:hypothetical protein
VPRTDAARSAVALPPDGPKPPGEGRGGLGVPATVAITLDGATIGATGASTIADIVVRDCSTVALYR